MAPGWQALFLLKSAPKRCTLLHGKMKSWGVFIKSKETPVAYIFGQCGD